MPKEPTVTRAQLEEYAAVIDTMGDDARTSLDMALRLALQDFDPKMKGAEWVELRQYLIELLYHTRTYWGDAAGLAACQFYDGVVGERGRLNPARMPDAVSYKACADSIRALAGLLFEGELDKFIEKVCDNAENGIRSYANETVMRNAKRDSRNGVRYARVPVGMETCAFCIMLASRGFVYHSRKSAGENAHMHPHCDCKIVPGFEGDTVEGYDPEAYLDIWYEYAVLDKYNHTDVKATLNNIRRDYLYPLHKGHINAVKRDYRARVKARKEEREEAE